VTDRLIKVEAAGNDFILGTGSWGRRLIEQESLAMRLCDRRRGIGADGVLALSDLRQSRVRLDYRNSDGSLALFCGNGTRCAARVAVELLGAPPELVVETGWAAIPATVVGSTVSLELPPPAIAPEKVELEVGDRCWRGWRLQLGVPHAVFEVADPAALELAELAPLLRNHRGLGPEGANLSFVATAAPLAIRSWERGVEGETLCCGSGVVAAALVAMAERGLRRLEAVPASGDKLVVEALGQPPHCASRFTGSTRLVAELEPTAELLAS
jgi:diaminopimelate epimerase